jgi:hypothetical protein
MAMYHSWGTQNAWLRQIHGSNRLYIPRALADEMSLEDGDWVYLSSRVGRIKVRVKPSDGVNAGTVWTWNAIGKRAGAWNIAPDAKEMTEGFLLNHLIGDMLPDENDGSGLSNSDPITGQAAWFDLKVALEKAPPGVEVAEPRFETIGAPPGFPGACRCSATAPGLRQSGAADDQPSSAAAGQAPWPGHRSRHLRWLPCLRGQLQGMEYRRLSRALDRYRPLWRRSQRRLVKPHSQLRGDRRGNGWAHRLFPEILPTLRGRTLRHPLPDRRLL